MNENSKRYTGGCLCGALRYEAEGEPKFAGHCYCADCRKVSGSGFLPFMGFPSSAVRISDQSQKFTSKAAIDVDGLDEQRPRFWAADGELLGVLRALGRRSI